MAGYWAKYLRHFERTDDAYVQGNLVQITPQVAGTVVSVNADDTDFVKAGQTLVTLDRADAEVALEQAQAALAQTVREVRTLYVSNTTWSANIAQREAEVSRARTPSSRAREDDLARRQSLADIGRRQRRGDESRAIGRHQRARRARRRAGRARRRRSSSSRPTSR